MADLRLPVNSTREEQGWHSGESARHHQCVPGSIPGSASYVGWVCWFSALLQEVFLRVLWFSPLHKNQHLIWFELFQMKSDFIVEMLK